MTEPSRAPRKIPLKNDVTREVSQPPSLFQSPLAIAVMALGVALVLGVPYLAFRTIPGSDKPLTTASKGDPNATLDLKEFDPLPPDLKEGAHALYLAEDAITPEVLEGLPEPGDELIYPVSEAVDGLQPALTWNNFGPAPYSILLKNKLGQVVSQMDGLQTRAWLVSTPLERGGSYTWQVTAANRDVQLAGFVVLSNEAFQQWQMIRSSMANAHLAVATVAEQLGLLTIAEREYQAAVKAYPQAEAPGRMLTNVLSLRDASAKDNGPQPLLQ